MFTFIILILAGSFNVVAGFQDMATPVLTMASASWACWFATMFFNWAFFACVFCNIKKHSDSPVNKKYEKYQRACKWLALLCILECLYRTMDTGAERTTSVETSVHQVLLDHLSYELCWITQLCIILYHVRKHVTRSRIAHYSVKATSLLPFRRSVGPKACPSHPKSLPQGSPMTGKDYEQWERQGSNQYRNAPWNESRNKSKNESKNENRNAPVNKYDNRDHAATHRNPVLDKKDSSDSPTCDRFAQQPTLQTLMKQLKEEDPACVFIVRKVNKLGFKSEEILRKFFAKYSARGETVRVLVAHSKVLRGGELTYRPGSLGFMIMKNPLSVARVLAEGPVINVQKDADSPCYPIGVQPYSSRTKEHLTETEDGKYEGGCRYGERLKEYFGKPSEGTRHSDVHLKTALEKMPREAQMPRKDLAIKCSLLTAA